MDVVVNSTNIVHIHIYTHLSMHTYTHTHTCHMHAHIHTHVSHACTHTHTDSKGNPRCTTNSKGRKRRPGTRELSSAVKTTDGLFLDFLRQCLQWDPESRITPEEALRHQWITEVCVHVHVCVCVCACSHVHVCVCE